MGKVDFFTILLQKEPPIYFSGESIIGQVKIRISERLKINSLKCLLEGCAFVHW
jgi:hypothetical protein